MEEQGERESGRGDGRERSYTEMSNILKTGQLERGAFRKGVYGNLACICRCSLPVVAVSVGADRDVKFHFVILVVGLGLPQVPLDTRTPQHHATVREMGRGSKPPT